jgi:hypothetical protein
VRAVSVPGAGRPIDTSHPTQVVGHGTAASCTSAATVAAVRAGGIIRFSCGPRPVVIRMRAAAKVVNTGRGMDNLALSEPGLAEAGRSEPQVHERQFERPAL